MPDHARKCAKPGAKRTRKKEGELNAFSFVYLCGELPADKRKTKAYYLMVPYSSPSLAPFISRPGPDIQPLRPGLVALIHIIIMTDACCRVFRRAEESWPGSSSPESHENEATVASTLVRLDTECGHPRAESGIRV